MKIVKVKSQKKHGILTITSASQNDIKEMTSEYQVMPELIIIKDLRTIGADLLMAIARFYIGGVTIKVCHSDIGEFIFQTPKAKEFWKYEFIDLNVFNCPAKFRNHPRYSKILVEALKISKPTLQLEQAVAEYNELRKTDVFKKNNCTYEQQELFYKDMQQLVEYGFKVYSPNEKTFWEYTAEKTYQKDLSMIDEDAPDTPLTEDQLKLLSAEGPQYGIELQEYWQINYTRKTRHGYTVEPSISVCPTQTDMNRGQYNKKEENYPKEIRQCLKPRKLVIEAEMRKAYMELCYLKGYGDEFLNIYWHRCPQCNCLYDERIGCCDIEPISFIPAPKLLYGSDGEFEDREIIKSFSPFSPNSKDDYSENE